MSEKVPATAITLTPEQLKEMLMSMAAELRRPPDPTPEELAAKESDLRNRRANAESIKQQMANRDFQRRTCSHCRPNGSTAAVFVQNMGMMLCQHCQAMIYPEGSQGVEYGIYDTALFNRLFQLSLDASGVMA